MVSIVKSVASVRWIFSMMQSNCDASNETLSELINVSPGINPRDVVSVY